MKLRLLPLPLVLFGLVLGVVGGWIRLGWQIALPNAAYLHGLLMTGGFLGTLITLERTVSMPSSWWRMFPAVAALSTVFFLAGHKQLGIAALLVGNSGLLAVYVIQLSRHKDAYWYLLLMGGMCWLIGNLMVWRTGLVAAGTTWWVAFIFLTIVGERLELTRYLNVPGWAKGLLWLLMAVLVVGVALPFHAATGAVMMGVSSIGAALWLLRFDMARVGIRKAGFHRYVATGLLVGYGWLLVNGCLLLLSPSHRYYYDLYLHTFFLGFAFSMIWAHAPIIFPAILKATVRPYHPALWFFWSLFQLTLIGRILFTLLENGEMRQWLGGVNGVTILLMFAAMAVIMLLAIRKEK
ncbi:MAG: hypothetical protein Kow0075_14960 [Salibacteraceae bacterium]